MHGRGEKAVNNNWIFLDLCFTISCAKNDTIVSNIMVTPPAEHLQVYINVGHMDYTLTGTLNNLPMSIYVKNNSMTVILYFK